MIKKQELINNSYEFKDKTYEEKSSSSYYRDLIVHFLSYRDLVKFNKLFNFNITNTTKEFIFDTDSIRKKYLLLLTDTEFLETEKIELNANKELDYYWGMPEYKVKDLTPRYSILFHFTCLKDLTYFVKKTGNSITDKTKFVYYPARKQNCYTDYVYVPSEPVQPNFPLFIVSKGRWDISYTANHLLKMGIKFHIIVEEQEYDKYREYFDEDFLLVLPKEYKLNYNTADIEGNTLQLGTGSGPARNFAWDTSIKWGFDYHWVMDDNIHGFYLMNNNEPHEVLSGAFFRAIEEFVIRYKNMAMAGPNYNFFVPFKEPKLPITFNTRIYSCNLIKNDVPFRWRCRYNEDTDLSLCMLKAGYTTALFNSFVQYKSGTQSCKGGNTDSIYQVGTGVKSRALARLHPDCVDVVNRYGRIHHYINYKIFNNKLVYKSNINIQEGTVNNYTLQLVKSKEK